MGSAMYSLLCGGVGLALYEGLTAEAGFCERIINVCRSKTLSEALGFCVSLNASRASNS
jgi:hypothetical protein